MTIFKFTHAHSNRPSSIQAFSQIANRPRTVLVEHVLGKFVVYCVSLQNDARKS